MTGAAWVSAAAAVLSAALAGWAWWSATKSKSARKAAEQASERAARAVSAAEAQVAVAHEQVRVLERMADQAAGPEFWLESTGGATLRLHTRLPEVTVLGLDSPPHSRFMLRSALPATMTPSRPVNVISEETNSSPDETAVGLLIEGQGETTWVSLPPGVS